MAFVAGKLRLLDMRVVAIQPKEALASVPYDSNTFMLLNFLEIVFFCGFGSRVHEYKCLGISIDIRGTKCEVVRPGRTIMFLILFTHRGISDSICVSVLAH